MQRFHQHFITSAVALGTRGPHNMPRVGFRACRGLSRWSSADVLSSKDTRNFGFRLAPFPHIAGPTYGPEKAHF